METPRCRSAAVGFAEQKAGSGGVYRIAFDQEKCIGCQGCEVACKTWRAVEQGVKWRWVSVECKGRYPDVQMTATSVACRHCASSRPAQRHVRKGRSRRGWTDNGIVLVDNVICSGCGLCRDASPYGVPRFGRDGKMQECDMCISDIELGSESPPCVATCLTERW
jgi:anaerobic dimethyl sulfoxide reductase subunit B